MKQAQKQPTTHGTAVRAVDAPGQYHLACGARYMPGYKLGRCLGFELTCIPAAAPNSIPNWPGSRLAVSLLARGPNFFLLPIFEKIQKFKKFKNLIGSRLQVQQMLTLEVEVICRRSEKRSHQKWGNLAYLWGSFQTQFHAKHLRQTQCIHLQHLKQEQPRLKVWPCF